MGHPQPLFSSFQTFQCLQQIHSDQCPSSIRYWGSNPQPSEHESPPITTRPGLPPKSLHNLALTFLQDNIGHLYNVIKKMKRGKEAIAMAPEQTKTYMQAFSGWQRLNPKTKLGRPPPDGKPGFNPDLMLLDLDKLRSSAKFKTYFDERKLNALVKNYVFHSSGEIPSLGDMVNLIAADSESLIWKLGCEWNRLAKETSDMLDKQVSAHVHLLVVDR